MLSKAQLTTDGSDLNTLTMGVAWCGFATCKNSPWTSGFGVVLSVSASDGLPSTLQIAVRYNAKGIAHRVYTNSQWYAWQIITG